MSALPQASIAHRLQSAKVVLAQSGNWVAMAHRVSVTAAPDVCIVFPLEANVAFRADDDGVDFRVTDKSWSLPANTTGSIIVSAGDWKTELAIAENTATTIDAPLSASGALAFFAAMDKSASMTVTVGKAKPFAVSLTGSTRATNAFRTCAGIHSNSETPGGNPFKNAFQNPPCNARRQMSEHAREVKA